MSRLSKLSAQHAHRYTFEGTVLERVLLTIIKAHPAAGSDWQDYERLRVAMTALTGQSETLGIEADLSAALDWMVRERQHDLCDRDMKSLSGFDYSPIRTVHELAMLAANDFLQLGDIAELAERLCAMYKAEGCLSRGGFDAEREALESEAVERVCAELAEWDFCLRQISRLEPKFCIRTILG